MNENNRPLTSEEMKDGDSQTTFRGEDCEQSVRTKEGEDGVLETHVNVKLRSGKKYFIPK